MRLRLTMLVALAVLLAAPAAAWAPEEARKQIQFPESLPSNPVWDIPPFQRTQPESRFRRWSEPKVFNMTATVQPLWHVPAVNLGPDAEGRVVVAPQGHAGQWRLEGWRVTLSNSIPPFSDDHLHFQYRYSFFHKSHRHR